jgi:hypothetical protein
MPPPANGWSDRRAITRSPADRLAISQSPPGRIAEPGNQQAHNKLTKETAMRTNHYLVAELARLRGQEALRSALAARSLRIVDRPEVRQRLLRRNS